jgi:hypothetical protein
MFFSLFNSTFIEDVRYERGVCHIILIAVNLKHYKPFAKRFLPLRSDRPLDIVFFYKKVFEELSKEFSKKFSLLFFKTHAQWVSFSKKLQKLITLDIVHIFLFPIHGKGKIAREIRIWTEKFEKSSFSGSNSHPNPKKIGFLDWVWVFLSQTQTHTQKPKKNQYPTQHPTQKTQKIWVSKKILSVY